MMKKLFSKQNRALLAELVRTDFKLRYQGSVLGYAWSLLRPLLLFVILYVVFVKFLKLGTEIPHFPVYLLLGIVMWNFFAEMTSQSLGSIVARGDLIRKIRIPRWMIVISSSFSALINLALTLIVIAIFMAINHVDLMRSAALFPIILLQLYLFALGLSLILSGLFVKYRDMSYIWEVILQAGFYATPIIYPLSRIANVNYQKLLLLNPVATAIQDARYVLISHSTTTINILLGERYARMIPYGITILFLLIGIWYFKKNAPHFAEEL